MKKRIIGRIGFTSVILCLLIVVYRFLNFNKYHNNFIDEIALPLYVFIVSIPLLVYFRLLENAIGESAFVALWIKRFSDVNKGIMRILIILTFPILILSIICFYVITSFFLNYNNVGEIKDVVVELGLISFIAPTTWILFRLILWVVDGFDKN